MKLTTPLSLRCAVEFTCTWSHDQGSSLKTMTRTNTSLVFTSKTRKKYEPISKCMCLQTQAYGTLQKYTRAETLWNILIFSVVMWSWGSNPTWNQILFPSLLTSLLSCLLTALICRLTFTRCHMSRVNTLLYTSTTGMSSEGLRGLVHTLRLSNTVAAPQRSKLLFKTRTKISTSSFINHKSLVSWSIAT